MVDGRISKLHIGRVSILGLTPGAPGFFARLKSQIWRTAWTCQVISGSIGLASCGSARLEGDVAGLFPDNARYQKLERHGDAVCGQVNVPGEEGTDGYTRFVGVGGTGTLDPVPGYAEPEIRQFERTCQMVSTGGTAMDHTACDLARQARLASRLKTAFEAEWKTRCS